MLSLICKEFSQTLTKYLFFIALTLTISFKANIVDYTITQQSKHSEYTKLINEFDKKGFITNEEADILNVEGEKLKAEFLNNPNKYILSGIVDLAILILSISSSIYFIFRRQNIKALIIGIVSIYGNLLT
ncbi:hypothetical protein ATN88_24065 [Enterovibrio coralii]|uniref:Uncharacterized protein n=1 Tax=Enterovibrio coralii TaxID=294935 RepID=A0A135IA17_9GAMM|nr:hypothetical protein ATN88_24065 [Enterovibrio coralii]